MALNKRGIFFTLLVIVLIMLFLLTISFFYGVSPTKAIQKRVSTLDNFVFAIEEDLPRQLFVSGFRTIFLMEQQILQSGIPISDVDAVFEEAFFNGTFNNQSESLLFGTTFYDIEDSLRARALKIGANVSFKNPALVVSQGDPWNIKMSLSMDLLVEDLSGLAFWNKTLVVERLISIENFDDPIYYLNTNGLVTNKVIKTPYELNSVGNLSLHLDGSYYINSSDAPSFLMRLEGNLGANPEGIESLVNLDDLAAQGVTLNSGSVVDHDYFPSGGGGCNVLEGSLPSWFMLDSAHDQLYGVNCF